MKSVIAILMMYLDRCRPNATDNSSLNWWYVKWILKINLILLSLWHQLRMIDTVNSRIILSVRMPYDHLGSVNIVIIMTKSGGHLIFIKGISLLVNGILVLQRAPCGRENHLMIWRYKDKVVIKITDITDDFAFWCCCSQSSKNTVRRPTRCSK